MICKSCGAEIPDSSQFCSSCGKPANLVDTYQNIGFDRKTFKSQAKIALTKKYWYAFLICLINTIILGGMRFGFPSGNSLSSATQKLPLSSQTGSLLKTSSLAVSSRLNPSLLMTIGIIAIVIIFVVMAFALAYTFFLASPFAVGKTKFFIDNRSGNCELGNIIFAFKGGHYMNIVKSMAWRVLFQILWSLLLIIPGIVKSYSYYLVPYILADNPDIGYARALKLSMDMTRGYKFEMFVMQLSFLGWYLLGLICLVVGTLFVNPYYEASLAEMYVTLRNNAMSAGLCTPQELNLV